MITLSNIFSREKTLFYFTMWNDSDRLGYKRFLNHEVKNNLFIVSPEGQKGSVWYSQIELQEIESLLKVKVTEPSFQSEIIKTLDESWIQLSPYLKQEKKITNADELAQYYSLLVEWWSAMNTVFGVPDSENAPADFKKETLDRRIEAEKYSEEANKLYVEFWNNYYPQYKQFVSVLLPEEAISIAKGKKPEVFERLQGCFMLNRRVFPLDQLEKILTDQGLSLEVVKAEQVVEIKGRPAQIGKVTGTVKIVRVKADASKIQPSDVLVTEMTNPDYVPYMKIAGAIVTDEGGATCHAAIASRELKVPCVVGTKIATKVLKDGDLVEVDANTGVVKILK